MSAFTLSVLLSATAFGHGFANPVIQLGNEVDNGVLTFWEYDGSCVASGFNKEKIEKKEIPTQSWGVIKDRYFSFDSRYGDSPSNTVFTSNLDPKLIRQDWCAEKGNTGNTINKHGLVTKTLLDRQFNELNTKIQTLEGRLSHELMNYFKTLNETATKETARTEITNFFKSQEGRQLIRSIVQELNENPN